MKTEQQIIAHLLQIKGCRYRKLIRSNAFFYQGLKFGFLKDLKVYIRIGNSNYSLFQSLNIEELNVIEFEWTTYAELPDQVLEDLDELKKWVISAYREACRFGQLDIGKSKKLF